LENSFSGNALVSGLSNNDKVGPNKMAIIIPKEFTDISVIYKKDYNSSWTAKDF